jgi:hypothetical protein
MFAVLAAVPLRRRVRRVFVCSTCDDLKVVSRIRGGLHWWQSCPDCAGGSWL